MNEEKKPTVVPAVLGAPLEIPAIVDPAKAADVIVLSQAPVIPASDAKPVVDKPSAIVPPAIPPAK